MLCTTCYDWGVDDTHALITLWVEPCEDISRTVKVSVNAMSAGTLEESNFACSDLTADGTAFAGVLRIDENNLHASFLCLVGEEVTELVETPTTQKPIESSTLALFSYPFKVLQRNHAACGESLNNLLGDLVVDITHKQSLPSADTLQVSFSRRSAFALKSTPQSLHLVKGVGYSLKEHIIACDCEVVYAEVNTDVVNRTIRNSLTDINLFGNNHVQPQTTFIIPTQLSTLNIPSEIFGVVVGECEVVLLASVEGRQTTNLLGKVDSVTLSTGVSDAQILTKDRLRPFEAHSGFDSTDSLADTGNRQISGEFSIRTDVFVDEVMQPETVTFLVLPRDIDNQVACDSELPQSINECDIIGQPKFQRPIHNTSCDFEYKNKEGGDSRNSSTQ